jgi:hypothetical protein
MSQAGHPSAGWRRCAGRDSHALHWSMVKVLLVLFILLFVVIGGGFAYLATRDMPPPTTRIEREIPNDRLMPK